MPTIDDDGRVPLPDDVVERLDVEPGETPVSVTAESGRIVVEPDPEEVVAATETPDEQAGTDGEGSPAAVDDPPWDPDVFSRKHRERIRRGARGED